jgi:hypothetical protein
MSACGLKKKDVVSERETDEKSEAGFLNRCGL